MKLLSFFKKKQQQVSVLSVVPCYFHAYKVFVKTECGALYSKKFEVFSYPVNPGDKFVTNLRGWSKV